MSKPSNIDLHQEAFKGARVASELENSTHGHDASTAFAHEVSTLRRLDHGKLSTEDTNTLLFAAQDLHAKGILPNLTLADNEINKAAGLPKLSPGELQSPGV